MLLPIGLLGLLQVSAASTILPRAALPPALLPRRSSPAFVDVISGTPFNGPSEVLFDARGTAFDGPKIKNLNSTTFDLWYFDVVSEDLDKWAIVVFYTATPQALFSGIPDLGTTTFVQIAVLDDTQEVAAGSLFGAENLTVTTRGDGSSGVLAGDDGDATWTGSKNLASWSVAVNDRTQNIVGTLDLEAIAPAHYPCGPASSSNGQTFELARNLGWANAVPDAHGTVDLNVNGTSVRFSGFGYHDKNWGAAPWSTLLRMWYWGHARVGPYTVVWFDYVTPEGKEGGSTYISRNGTILSATCNPGPKIRPSAPADSVFPPTPDTPPPEEFTFSLPVPGHSNMNLKTVNASLPNSHPGVFVRWVSKVVGEFDGEELEGSAMYEQFTFDN